MSWIYQKVENILHILSRLVFSRPESVLIDASTLCQLRCVLCPQENIKKGVGSGYLKFDHFRKFLDRNKYVKNIELSNWGEIFLNPELNDIIKYSHEKGVSLTALNGVNLNTVSEKTLECLVKYKFREITISIDGASDEIYRIYRRRGDFNGVVKNIKRINNYKQKFHSDFPQLTWQFIIFGHNEHEIPTAREHAKELNMKFVLVHNTVPSYSPPENREFIRKEMDLVVSVDEEDRNPEKRHPHLYVCQQLWISPQINWDGRLFGCCAHKRGDLHYGNVFENGLEPCTRSKRYVYAKKMLLGKEKPREDIPCYHCNVFKWRRIHQCFVEKTTCVPMRSIRKIWIVVFVIVSFCF